MNGIWLENLCVDIGAEVVKSNKAAQRTVDVNCFCLCVCFFFPILIKLTLKQG